MLKKTNKNEAKYVRKIHEKIQKIIGTNSILRLSKYYFEILSSNMRMFTLSLSVVPASIAIIPFA